MGARYSTTTSAPYDYGGAYEEYIGGNERLTNAAFAVQKAYRRHMDNRTTRRVAAAIKIAAGGRGAIARYAVRRMVQETALWDIFENPKTAPTPSPVEIPETPSAKPATRRLLPMPLVALFALIALVASLTGVEESGTAVANVSLPEVKMWMCSEKTMNSPFCIAQIPNKKRTAANAVTKSNGTLFWIRPLEPSASSVAPAYSPRVWSSQSPPKFDNEVSIPTGRTSKLFYTLRTGVRESGYKTGAFALAAAREILSWIRSLLAQSGKASRDAAAWLRTQASKAREVSDEWHKAFRDAVNETDIFAYM